MTDTSLHLQAINLSCVRQQKTLFTQLSFQLTAGEILFIAGANGSGKSSLLRLIAGLATPSSGEVRWCNQSIQSLHTDYSDHLHYVGHMNGIKLGLTVKENIQLAQCMSLAKPSRELENVLSLLQLSAHHNTPARYLSAGQKRRLALAKLFLFPKALWILDEPFTALDIPTQTLFLSQLEKHVEEGGIALMSSHHAINIKAKIQTLRLTSC